MHSQHVLALLQCASQRESLRLDALQSLNCSVHFAHLMPTVLSHPALGTCRAVCRLSAEMCPGVNPIRLLPRFPPRSLPRLQLHLHDPTSSLPLPLTSTSASSSTLPLLTVSVFLSPIVCCGSAVQAEARGWFGYRSPMRVYGSLESSPVISTAYIFLTSSGNVGSIVSYVTVQAHLKSNPADPIVQLLSLSSSPSLSMQQHVAIRLFPY